MARRGHVKFMSGLERCNDQISPRLNTGEAFPFDLSPLLFTDLTRNPRFPQKGKRIIVIHLNRVVVCNITANIQPGVDKLLISRVRIDVQNRYEG